MRRRARTVLACVLLSGLCVPAGVAQDQDAPVTGRRPENDTGLEYWLRNALVAHRFSVADTALALALTGDEIDAACRRLQIDPAAESYPHAEGVLAILPYPGGRHPRIGFLEGAIDPQRETKASIFTPWQPADHSRADYIVADIPEAIWSNLGLTYLAHTHVPTVWTKAGITLPVLEWTRLDDGVLTIERTLPNGIAFTSRIAPRADHVAMRLTLTNGTDETLSDLRVQNCVMLKDADGFAEQTNDNKLARDPYMAVRHESLDRWVLTAWKPNHRTWGNARCPCLHSDPQFPDCPPGETRVVRGWLSFYEGTDIDGEISRIDALNWWGDDGAE